MRLYSYVVRYDSGFAPNPFYGYCTLATCKAPIRKSAQIGDWLVGCASNHKSIRRGGHLVYAMRVTETTDFRTYSADRRFAMKVPYRAGSRKQSCGDNIYFRDATDSHWMQRDSFHSMPDGSPNPDHIARDTGVDRILISEDFVYFGGYGPEFPQSLRNCDGEDISKKGIGYSVFPDGKLVQRFVEWIRSIRESGYRSAPTEWKALRGQLG